MRDKYRVRDYVSSDFRRVNELWLDTALGGAERGDNEEIIEESIRLGGRLLLLVDAESENIVGSSWMTNDGRRIHLHHFGIDSAQQGKGLSKILMEHSLTHIKAMGMQVKIEVHETNIRALNLYRKYGFKYLGDYGVHIIRDISTIKDYNIDNNNSD